MSNRGYFGVGVYHPKTAANIGTLWRSASVFGAAFIFTIGKRYKKQASDTTSTPTHTPLFHFNGFEDFKGCAPYSCPIIAIEQTQDSVNISSFNHPERAVYLLGAEDHGIPDSVLSQCHKVVEIRTPTCLNVAVAGSIILYDRQTKREKP